MRGGAHNRGKSLMNNATQAEAADIQSIMRAVRRDRKSWEDWFCLKVELPSAMPNSRRAGVREGLFKGIERYLANKMIAILPDADSIVFILCKGVSEGLMRDISRHVADYVAETAQVQARVTVFDLFRDAEEFAASCVPANIVSGGRIRPGDTLKAGRPKVLLVEDDPVTRWIARTGLKNDCHLATAQDSASALRMYHDYRPDIVFLDISLPGESGRDVLARLLKTDPGAYVVMFSSHDGVDNIVALMVMGARGFIAKPFDREKLLYYIDQCGGAA
jgi:two-component system, chemotaxis family, chemotaxis protein CheY